MSINRLEHAESLGGFRYDGFGQVSRPSTDLVMIPMVVVRSAPTNFCCHLTQGWEVFGWFLNLCYLALLLAISPVIAWKRWRLGKYRRGWSEKLWGRVPKLDRPVGDRIWLHAVSVGEVLQLPQIVDRLLQHRPSAEIIISTTTETGFDVATAKFPDHTVNFFPLDFTWAVSEALSRIQPTLIVLVELELWPNFIFTAKRRVIPLALINARLSAKSFRGYRRIRALVSRILRCFDCIAVQNDEYAERFRQLGCRTDRLTTSGSIKFDGVSTHRHHPQTEQLRTFFGIETDQTVFIAGSTQAPEEEYALESYNSLLPEHPGLRLMLVPRHPERAPEVAELIRRHGFPVTSRSGNHTTTSGGEIPSVRLLDTVGELGHCWGLADIAFVGGSFTNRGGQNMIEPAAKGAAVCFGPNVWNFKQVVEILLLNNAARQVGSQQELDAFVREMLVTSSRRAAIGLRAQQIVLAQQGATDRTVQLLLELLPLDNKLKRSRVA